MKKNIYLFATVLIIFSGCKKNEIKREALATVSVLNVVIDGKVARLNTALRDSCLNMDYKHFSILAKDDSPLKLYASGLQSITYYNQSLRAKSGDIYSLFLTGTHSSPESVLIKETIPEYPSEEVINVRLINLVPESVPLSLTLGNKPTENVFSNIGYKQVSEFKTIPFPTILPDGGKLFQIRDASGNILTTYDMPDFGTVSTSSSRHRNITVAVKGVNGGTGDKAFGVVVLPHY
ncbi:hypothetical protein [Pedobacter sp. GR22-6]|uniref:hypothetical protein n=1 Tax=Pedobacter sp. GR22-6 TaxID=3127957 RepID=UPI00307D6772